MRFDKAAWLTPSEEMDMNDDDLIALVKTYFAAVDAEDLAGVLATLSPDCRFSIETHNVRLQGHEALTGMFQRLWQAHAAVKHDQFTFVPAASDARIAAQFQVTNTLEGGGEVYKSNCNFFHVRGGKFDTVAV